MAGNAPGRVATGRLIVGLVMVLPACRGADDAGASSPPVSRDGASSSGGSDSGSKLDAAVISGPPGSASCTPSTLYGKDGELWQKDGRLIDVSFAGYHTGIDPIPNVTAPMRSVKDFGALGDGVTDDTQAFLDGIMAVTDGVLFVPEGRYVITQRLTIAKSNFVLRGQGMGTTTLFFPKSLGDIYGLTVSPGGTNWSFNGGLLTVMGADAGALLATVTANAPHGANQLMVSTTAGIQVGDWVRVLQTDNAGSLFKALYAGTAPGNVAEDGGTQVFRFYSRVTAVEANSITLERTLPFQVDTTWTPEVRAAKPSVREVGIENLTVEMLGTPYPGHFMEHGYNAIYYTNVFDSWVRDVQILNADFGVSIYASFFCTVTGVILDSNFDRGPSNGHHGLNSARGADVLFTKFDVRKKYVHDLTVDGYTMGTVFSDGTGLDLNMDHHGRAPYGTLWTNLNLGRGTRAFASGGASNRLPCTAAYTTLWNVTATAPVGFPAAGFGPLMNFVGVTGTTGTAPAGYAVENIPAENLCQPDLYQAMLARRLQRQQ
jgi:hypothetical protein